MRLEMRWRTGGHGHIAAYGANADEGTLTIAHIFHASQDWERKQR